MKPSAPSSAAGTASSTISGSMKLSYCAESTRNTKTMPSAKIKHGERSGGNLIELQARSIRSSRRWA